MASIITATTTSGLTQSADNSGVLQLASGTGNLVTVPSVTGTMITTASTFAGTGPAFSATRSSNQSVSSGTWTKIQLNVEEFDTANCFDSTTNYRFTPTVAGYYETNARFGIATTDTRLICSVYKNGTEFKRGLDAGSALMGGATVSALIYLNGSTDYIEMFILIGSTQNIIGNAVDLYFQASMVRAA